MLKTEHAKAQLLANLDKDVVPTKANLLQFSVGVLSYNSRLSAQELCDHIYKYDTQPWVIINRLQPAFVVRTEEELLEPGAATKLIAKELPVHEIPTDFLWELISLTLNDSDFREFSLRRLAVFVAILLDNNSHNQIANAISVPVSTVKSVLRSSKRLYQYDRGTGIYSLTDDAEPLRKIAEYLL